MDRELYVVWAVGRLDLNKEPAFHDLYPKRDIKIHFNTTEPYNDCFSFAARNAEKWDAWERPQIYDKAIRSFTATLGPAGGKRGYQGITGKKLSLRNGRSLTWPMYFRTCFQWIGVVHQRIFNSRDLGSSWSDLLLQSVRRE